MSISLYLCTHINASSHTFGSAASSADHTLRTSQVLDPYISICRPIHPSISPPICISIYPLLAFRSITFGSAASSVAISLLTRSDYKSIYIYIHVDVFTHLPLHPSVYLSIHCSLQEERFTFGSAASNVVVRLRTRSGYISICRPVHPSISPCICISVYPLLVLRHSTFGSAASSVAVSLRTRSVDRSYMSVHLNLDPYIYIRVSLYVDLSLYLCTYINASSLNFGSSASSVAVSLRTRSARASDDMAGGSSRELCISILIHPSAYLARNIYYLWK